MSYASHNYWLVIVQLSIITGNYYNALGFTIVYATFTRPICYQHVWRV